MQTPVTFALVFLFAAATGFGTGCSSSSMRIVRCTLGDAQLKVELAETEGQRQRGLMYRNKLGTNRGMIFVYDGEEVRSFWMKNTHIPLSVAFIDESKKIVHITDMQPRTKDSHSSLYPCQYVLEVNKGWFDDHDVEVGALVEFEVPEPEE
jgi:uncharacterized protein